MSIISLIGSQNGGSCGYCKNDSTFKSSWYAQSDSLTVKVYKLLLDRGWRRSGCTLYKPDNKTTCCSAYTIRCDVLGFKLSRSQKKVLTGMANFLNTGLKPKNIQKLPDVAHLTQNQSYDVNLLADGASGDIEGKISNQPKAKVASITNPSGDRGDVKTDFLTSSARCGSAHRQRWQALQNRLKDRSCREEIPFESLMEQYLERRNRRLAKNRPKQLEDYLQLVLPKEEAKHNLTIKLCRSYPRSAEFNDSLLETHKLFATYQMNIHGDKKEDASMASFIRFLVQSPLQNSDETNNTDALSFGSYHQQYWLDTKLIAVGVVDVLPGCLSSVYFYYDPNYKFLNLGTYSTLQEIAFTRHMFKSGSSRYSNFNYYYMGYYIHSCVKMRYKAKFAPCDLLCCETYTWIAARDCLQMLNSQKYARFSSTDAQDANALRMPRSELLARVICRLPNNPELVALFKTGQWTVEESGRYIFVPLNEASKCLRNKTVQMTLEFVKLVGLPCLDGTIKINFC